MRWLKRKLRNWINDDSDVLVTLDDYHVDRVDAHGF